MFRLPRSLSLAGLVQDPAYPWAGSPRNAFDWAAAIGARSIQLDLAAHGCRPRELDGSARRDVAAILRRTSLGLSGFDLWIPPNHFVDGAHIDRAVSALTQAIELAADLASLFQTTLPVCTSMPEATGSDVLGRLAAVASLHGVPLADHAWPHGVHPAGIGVGLDPATILISGADPGLVPLKITSRPLAARLSDISSAGRVAPGSGVGRLDALAYEAALTASGFSGPLVVDLRGLADQDRTARRLLESP